MRKMFRNIILGLIAIVAVSCIENDLSYPDVTVTFTSFEVEGQKSVAIDDASRTIDIVMGESADMSRVKVLGYSLTNDGEVVGGMPEFLDLTDTVRLTVRVYEDYVWTIKASQPVERYIRCDNQIGDAEIDADEKVAYVYVKEGQPLSSVIFNSMKLEPEGSVVERTMGFVPQDGGSVPLTEICDFPMELNCIIMRYFYVLYEGEEIRWSVKVLHKQIETGISSVNPWAFSAGVKGVTDGNGTPVVEYRKSSEAEWNTWDDVAVDGTEVTAIVTGLEADTEYVVRISNGTVSSDDVIFRTDTPVQLPNMSFDDWSKDNKYPNASGSDVWDSANSSGAAVTTSPSTDAVEGYAARLESVSAFGMLAAGNIFTGKFVKLAGMGAELDWGVPFESRPLALRGWYKYSPATINKVKDPYKDQMGKSDQCQILAFLTDWDSPFRVNTNTKTFVDLDNDPGIIALGQFNTSESSADYIEITIPLVYRSNDRIPGYIVIAGASSRFGDYFTGGIGSVLYLDQFELIYDPAELTEDEYEKVFSKVGQI
jgi:hypothetical protein